MKNKAKFLGIIMVVLIGLSIAACGDGSSNSGKNNSLAGTKWSCTLQFQGTGTYTLVIHFTSATAGTMYETVNMPGLAPQTDSDNFTYTLSENTVTISSPGEPNLEGTISGNKLYFTIHGESVLFDKII
jgi:hypothetical protein